VKFNLINNSVVIVAASHNPSLMSKAFLNKAEIVSDFAQIDENSLIITPALSQMLFKNGTSLQLDPDRLAVTSPADSAEAAQLVQKYCKTLPFIRATAVGINFAYTVTDYDFAAWFAEMKQLKFNGAHLHSVDIVFPVEQISCNVKIAMTNSTQGAVTFNFHRELPLLAIGEFDFSMVDKQLTYLNVTKDFLKTIF
jgi:hypothetical protein